jgi:hypothetical protein
MSDLTERRLGWGFGLLGGLLFIAGAIVSGAVGAFDLAVGHPMSALGAGTAAVLLFVVGALALFFSYLAHRPWQDRPLTAGILLVVVAAIGWGVLALGGNVLAIVGAVFVFLAGALLLVEPALTGAKRLATA